jgi:hypothetical protein
MENFPVDQEYGFDIHDGLSKLFEVSTYLRFPFTLEEAVNYFLPKSKITTAQLRSLLDSDRFTDLRFVVKDGYLLAGSEQSITSRSQKEEISAAKLESASTFAKLLTKLVPFIRTIAVTGSVAYGSAGKWDDVDLFVVTERNRLWLSAFLMLLQIRLYKVLRLRPSHLLPFCLSYVHDEQGFSAESRRNQANALFARELLKAIPIAGSKTYKRILEENRWVSEFYSASYFETLRKLGDLPDGIDQPRGKQGGVYSFLLDWIEAGAYIVLSRYLRLRAYLTNLGLKSEGNNIRAFDPVISPASCVYTSNFYRWLTALWETSHSR